MSHPLTIALLASVIALQVADVYTTDRILSNGGRELNPILGQLFSAVGMLPALIGMKALLIAVTISATWMMDMSPLFAGVITAIYVWVVAHNVRQLKS